MDLEIPDQCYLHPHIEKRWINDQIGYGLFAVKFIKKGETLSVISGAIMPKAEIALISQKFIEHLEKYSIEIDDDLILYPTDTLNNVFYMNHSCNPNAGNSDPYALIAMRDINAGEQITYDYATTDANDIFERGEMNCFCGAANCRLIITGDDWMKSELQEKYKGYFQPHIQRKIEMLKEMPE